MNTDDIDKFGHCVVCHKDLLTKRIVDGKVVDMFLPIYDETMFLLNSGSQMQVTICRPCKQLTDLSDTKVHNDIMAAVQKGWQLESKLLVDNNTWTKEQGDKYLNDMDKLDIDCNSENLDKYVIQQRQMVLLNANVTSVNTEAEVESVNNINP